MKAIKNMIGTGLQGFSLASSVLNIVDWMISLVTMVGTGYVADWAIGFAGMPVGVFSFYCCAALAVSLSAGVIGSSLKDYK